MHGLILNAIHDWYINVKSYFIRMEQQAANGNGLLKELTLGNVGLLTISEDEIFLPILSLFESIQDTSTPTPTSSLLKAGDTDVFLTEQCCTMLEKLK